MNNDIFTPVGNDEQEFYGDALILLRGAVNEFISYLMSAREYHIFHGERDPIAFCHARIKSAASMKAKLARRHLESTVANAIGSVNDAAGIRIICPFVDDIYVASEMIRSIPDVRLLQEKDYIKYPKPNGYRSYHMIIHMPLRFAPEHTGISLEIQLRTIAMDSWASIEHQLKYKRDIADTELIVRELKKCADEIASTDLSLQTLRDLITVKS